MGGGGGGAGLGGAIFIGADHMPPATDRPPSTGISAPNVSLTNVSFSNNVATGGQALGWAWVMHAWAEVAAASAEMALGLATADGEHRRCSRGRRHLQLPKCGGRLDPSAREARHPACLD